MNGSGNKMIFLTSKEQPLTCCMNRIFRQNSTMIDIDNYEQVLMKFNKSQNICIIISIDNGLKQMNKWLWNRLRLNEEQLGKELAGIPIIVIVRKDKFLESSESKVFRDFSNHHKYIYIPINLYKLMEFIQSVSPVDPNSLGIIKEDAPQTIINVLEHDLRSISQKFDYSGSKEEIKTRLDSIQFDVNNYKFLVNDPKKIARLTNEINKLETEIIRRKGKIWD